MAKGQTETEQLDRKRGPIKHSRWRLLVVSDEGTSSHALPEVGGVVLGRGEEADIIIDDRSVSRRHAILHLGPSLRLEDLGSANGTLVRGQLYQGNTIDVGVGDAIELGKTLLVLQPDEFSDGIRPWNLLSHPQFLEKIKEQTPPFAMLRVQVQGRTGVAQEVLSKLMTHDGDCVASFGPGMFEILTRDCRDREQTESLAQKISTQLVALGARVRIGFATAPNDGETPEELIAACSRPRGGPSTGVVLADDSMVALYRVVDRVAPSQLSVLVLGETGVGKEVLASEIHKRSKRNDKPLLRLNCAALSETLLESELFGHVRGAFTGADRDRVGLLESAQGGTVFLDEVGEISASVQAKLLRVLEQRQVMPVGSNESRPIDVRFVFATNRDLEAEVARGAFRADLFFRVNGISLVIPPLRERPSEIEPLAKSFLKEACDKEHRTLPEWTVEALGALKSYGWPGNVRELKSVMERLALFAGDETVAPEAVWQAIGQIPEAPASSAGALKEERMAAEKRAVLEALEACGGNQTAAAERLGVSRRTLVTRLQQYGMTRPRKK